MLVFVDETRAAGRAVSNLFHLRLRTEKNAYDVILKNISSYPV